MATSRSTVGALLLCLGLSICHGAGINRLRVVTTALPIYCFTKNIAGTAATVENLLPENVNPHDYQLSPHDAGRLKNADLVIASGLGLESTFSQKIRRDGARVVEASADLGKQRIAGDDGHNHGDGDHGHWNPHFWLDPILASHAVTNILRALQQADPGHSAEFASNAVAYVARLHALDATFRDALASHKGAAIVTYHNAFPYFARRYGLEIAGVIEPVPDVDPSPRDLSRLRATMRGRKIQVLFIEPGPPPRRAEQIRRDFNVKLAPLDPLETGELTGTSYEDGMRRNLNVLKRELDAPVP